MGRVKFQGLPLKSDSIFSRHFFSLGNLNMMLLEGNFTHMLLSKIIHNENPGFVCFFTLTHNSVQGGQN